MWRDQVVVDCYQVDCRYYTEIRFGTLGPVHFNGDLAIILSTGSDYAVDFTCLWGGPVALRSITWQV